MSHRGTSRWLENHDAKNDLSLGRRRGGLARDVPPGIKGIEVGMPNLLRRLMRRAYKRFFLSDFDCSEEPRYRPSCCGLRPRYRNHGFDHRFLCAKSPRDQQQEVLKSTRILEGIVAQNPECSVAQVLCQSSDLEDSSRRGICCRFLDSAGQDRPTVRLFLSMIIVAP